jgi:threonine dehydrogenase-like Zn-dependent dehydrogenase
LKAAVLEDFGKISIVAVPDPAPSRHEVSVRMHATGICQTDNLAYTGGRRDFDFPSILGHEMSGVVEEVGDDVKTVVPGDEVAISPVVPCGTCKFCRQGLTHHCKTGVTIGGEGQPIRADGGFAEYVRAPETVLYRKPAGISFEAAALTEPLGCCYKGLIEYSKLSLGEDVVIVGAGSMGLNLAQVAMAAGAGRVVVIDIVRERLEIARRLGVKHTIDSTVDDPVARVAEILPEGPDIVVEAAGSLDAAPLAFKLARRTTRVSVFGVIVPGEIAVSPKEIHFTEISVNGSFSVTPKVLVKSLELMEKGLVDPSRIITHKFPLEETATAFETMKTRDRVKVMVVQRG